MMYKKSFTENIKENINPGRMGDEPVKKPFRRLAVAVNFNKGLDCILRETKKLKDLFNAELVLIHAGKQEAEKEKDLDGLLEKYNYNKNKIKVIWQEGKPVDAILNICEENNVDLLIEGALKKENFFTYFRGSTARQIIRNAKCSVLVLTNLGDEPKKFKKITVSYEESDGAAITLETAFAFAKLQEAKQVFVVKESPLFGLARMVIEQKSEGRIKTFQSEYLADEHKKLDDLLAEMDTEGLNVKTKMLISKPGYAITRFAALQGADLLVVNAPEIKLGLMNRIFRHHLEHILSDLPCDLLIVYPKK